MQDDNNTTTDEQNQQPNTEVTIEPQSTPQAPSEPEATVQPIQPIVTPDSETPQSPSTTIPVTVTQPAISDTQQQVAPQLSAIPQLNQTGVVTGGVPTNEPPVGKKRSMKKVLIIVVAIAATLLLSVGGALAYMSTIPTPQEHLEKAVVNAASTNTLAQTANMTGSVEGTDTKANIAIESDFTDPSNPKTKGTISMDFEIIGTAVSLKSEFICVNKTECYIKYTDYVVPEELSTEASAYMNKWLQFDPTNDTEYADPFGMIKGLNTVLGDFITGNITGDAKTKIEQAAKESSAYSFTTATNEEVGGKKTLKYDISLNKDKVKELNNAVAKQYGLNADSVNDDISEKMNLWVSTDTDHILRAESEVSGVKISLDFSKFGESIPITAPTEFLTKDQYSNLF